MVAAYAVSHQAAATLPMVDDVPENPAMPGGLLEPATQGRPVIFLTAPGDPEASSSGLNLRAVTSSPAYQPVLSCAAARNPVAAGQGSHFDPAIVDAFPTDFDGFAAIARHYRDSG